MSPIFFLSIQSLVINSSARRTCTVGEIVNLVSADTQKLMDFVVYFNAVWLAPIEIALCLFFLWQVCRNVIFSKWLPFMHRRNLVNNLLARSLFLQHLGPSALAGIATVILIFPLNGFIAKKRSKLQVKAGMPHTSATFRQLARRARRCHSWFR